MRFPLLAALLFAPVIANADPTVPQLMNQAQRSYLGGDYDTAKELFNEVLEIEPNNTLAIQYLRNIRIREAALAPTNHDPLKGLILPSIQLKNATFSAALDFFKYQAAKQSVNVSFVAQLPEIQMERTVTLSLTQIPFLDALRYLCELDNADYRVDPYAIVIVPASAAGASPSSAAQ